MGSPRRCGWQGGPRGGRWWGSPRPCRRAQPRHGHWGCGQGRQRRQRRRRRRPRRRVAAKEVVAAVATAASGGSGASTGGTAAPSVVRAAARCGGASAGVGAALPPPSATLVGALSRSPTFTAPLVVDARGLSVAGGRLSPVSMPGALGAVLLWLVVGSFVAARGTGRAGSAVAEGVPAEAGAVAVDAREEGRHLCRRRPSRDGGAWAPKGRRGWLLPHPPRRRRPPTLLRQRRCSTPSYFIAAMAGLGAREPKRLGGGW